MHMFSVGMRCSCILAHANAIRFVCVCACRLLHASLCVWWHTPSPFVAAPPPKCCILSVQCAAYLCTTIRPHQKDAFELNIMINVRIFKPTRTPRTSENVGIFHLPRCLAFAHVAHKSVTLHRIATRIASHHWQP